MQNHKVMTNRLKLLISMITITLIACDHKPKTEDTTNPLIFPRGEKIMNSNFVGTAWLTSLVSADSMNSNAVGSVTFEPGARTNWHLHPAGQIILSLEGIGYYQEKGSKKIILRKGDVVKCPPNIPHWHGAGPDKEFVQVAITGRENGPTQWLEPVADDEYNAPAND